MIHKIRYFIEHPETHQWVDQIYQISSVNYDILPIQYWTTDPNKALQFLTKDNVEFYISQQFKEPFIVTEHMWFDETMRIGDRVRLKENFTFKGVQYMVGHKFNVVGWHYPHGFDLVDDVGNRINESRWIEDLFEVVEKKKTYLVKFYVNNDLIPFCEKQMSVIPDGESLIEHNTHVYKVRNIQYNDFDIEITLIELTLVRI